MKLKNVILLSGRPDSGKTEMLIAYANLYPRSTLFISLESSQEELIARGLKDEIKYLDMIENIDLAEYETVCIDYFELFNKEDIKQFISSLIERNLRVILATHMRRNGKVNDLFEQLGSL